MQLWSLLACDACMTSTRLNCVYIDTKKQSETMVILGFQKEGGRPLSFVISNDLLALSSSSTVKSEIRLNNNVLKSCTNVTLVQIYEGVSRESKLNICG